MYATVEYYSDNTTLIPTMYPDEVSPFLPVSQQPGPVAQITGDKGSVRSLGGSGLDFGALTAGGLLLGSQELQESLGPSLRCHLPLLVLLALLRLLL